MLKGKFVQRADDLLVDAELVQVSDNSHLWGGQFHRKLSETQAVQEEIARQVSAKLRGRLTGEEQKRITKRYTENPEAYQLYLKGRYLWEKRTEGPIKQSIEYLDQAIEKDPGYALAYAGLAQAYAVSTSYSFLSPPEAVPKSKAAAQRALDMDDSIAGAHAALAYALWAYDWSYPAAEEEFKKALSLDPRDATVHHWYGLMLISMGRSEESIAQMKRAVEIDPFSGIMRANLVRACAYGRQLDRAVEEGNKASGNFPNSYFRLGEAYEMNGMLEQAAAEYRKAADLSKGTAIGLLYLGIAQAVEGRRSEAQKTIDEMKALGARRYLAPSYIALVYAELGDNERAFEWLEKAYADHSWELVFSKVVPRLEPLRSDPRFTDLLRRIHLVS